MTETIKNYIQLIEYQQQIENFKKEYKELSNMDIVYNTIDFNLLENYLTNLGWYKKDENQFYIIWEEPNTKENLSFLINKEFTNWGENFDKNLKAIAKIHNLDIKDIIIQIFN